MSSSHEQQGCVLVEIQGRLVTVTLNRPDRRNALSIPMFDALEPVLSGLSRHGDVPIVLLRGEGSFFCSGFDLDPCLEDRSLMETYVRRLGSCIRHLRSIEGVVVAAVTGGALAGGCALVAACDMVIADAKAIMGYPVHRIGISPAVSVPSLISGSGTGSARTLALGHDPIPAERARQLGLVHAVVPDSSKVMDEAMARCRSLLEKGPDALAATKQWMNRLDGSDDHETAMKAMEISARTGRSDTAAMMLEQFLGQRRSRRGG